MGNGLVSFDQKGEPVKFVFFYLHLLRENCSDFDEFCFNMQEQHRRSFALRDDADKIKELQRSYHQLMEEAASKSYRSLKGRMYERLANAIIRKIQKLLEKGK